MTRFVWFIVLGLLLTACTPPPPLTQTWVRRFGTTSLEKVQALVRDTLGNLYVAGTTLGSLGIPSMVFLGARTVSWPTDLAGMYFVAFAIAMLKRLDGLLNQSA